MPYRAVTKPIPFPRAFGATSDAANYRRRLFYCADGARTASKLGHMSAQYQSARRTLRVPSVSAAGRRVKVEEVESLLLVRTTQCFERKLLWATRSRRLASAFGTKPNRAAARPSSTEQCGPSKSTPACQIGCGHFLFWTHVRTEPSDRDLGRLHS